MKKLAAALITSLFATVAFAQASAPAATAPAATATERWPRSFGQDLRVFKWNCWGNQAADFIAGSVAKYASSGVLSASLE